MRVRVFVKEIGLREKGLAYLDDETWLRHLWSSSAFSGI